jgi:hypothetical protein
METELCENAHYLALAVPDAGIAQLAKLCTVQHRQLN